MPPLARGPVLAGKARVAELARHRFRVLAGEYHDQGQSVLSRLPLAEYAELARQLRPELG